MSENGGDTTLDTPESVTITREFLEKALKRPITSYTVKAGCNPGDNFASILYAIKVEVTGDTDPLHLVLKVYPNLPARQQFLNECNLFSKEVKVYSELIPKFINFQEEEHGRNEGSRRGIIRPPVPTFVAGSAHDYTQESEVKGHVDPLENHLLMVDIRVCGGYRMVEKTLGLDLAHCRLAVREMARFHSLGWVYKHRKSLKSLTTEFPYLVETCFTTPAVEKMLMENFKLLEDVAVNNFEPNSAPVRGIAHLKAVGPMKIFSAFLRNDFSDPDVRKYVEKVLPRGDAEPWAVSCHGDCWVNNMLFKYDSHNDTGRSIQPQPPTAMMFVDLQLAREGCPTTELAYMFYSSTTYELRKNHMTPLLRHYHDEFTAVCAPFGVKPPTGFTFPELCARMRRAKLHGLLSACLILPIILSEEKEATKKLDELRPELSSDDNDDELTAVFKLLTANSNANTVLTKRFADMLKELEEDGIF